MDAADRAAWRQADRLFTRLAGLDPAERAHHLSAWDIDDEVRGRLLRLLASDEQEHAWLDDDAGPLARWTKAAMAQEPASMRGRRIGVWALDDELGRGGMAVIYRARRVDGAVDQIAALKLLTVGSLGRGGEHQFRSEVDILARLAHPHIVGLLDAGIADDGTPWLVMPLVDGEHIDDWCERQALDTRNVVTLVLQVSAAVAAAHRSLVIHCDLKPSNVLVDRHGQVRLLDFGVARLTGQIGEATRTHWRALTPQYAAPEQFTDAPPTTAMDIHGLGALLYRLLTGRPPRAGAALADITLPSRAAARDEAIGVRHRRALRDDLDRVLLKSLATDPAQRYGTVDELAADLRRWLLGEAVLAAAPGRAYRARKFVARHRIGVAACAAILFALAAGIGGTLWQAHQARLQAGRATAIKDFVLDLLSAANPDVAQGKDPPVSLLLDAGAERVRSEFATRPALRADMLATIGKAQLERGLLDAAGTSLDDAIAAFALGSTPDASRVAAMGDRAMLSYERGDPADALRRLQDAEHMAGTAGLAATAPVRLYLQVRSAEMQVETGQSAAAETSARSALHLIESAGATDAPIYPDALCVLATSLRHQNRDDDALAILLEAESAQQRIAPGHPKMAVILNDLGVLLHRLGRYREAEDTMRRAVERHQAIYGPMHPQTLQVMANRASLMRTWNGPAASAREYERLLPLVEQALGAAPHSQRVNMLGQLAVARDEAGERGGALQAAQDAWSMQNALPPDQRERTDWVAGVLGVMLFERNDPAAAALFAAYQPPRCDALEQRTPFTRHLCIARAWWAVEGGGECRVPPAQAPDPAALSATERDWWLGWWLLHKRCHTGDTATVDAAIDALGSRRTLPPWLTTRTTSSGRQASDGHARSDGSAP